MELGENLKALRIRNKMTLGQLAVKSEVSKSQLSQIERNTSVPTVTSLQKIVDALDVRFSDLFDKNANPANNSEKTENKNQSNHIAVVRKNERKKLIMPWGASYEMLCPNLKGKMEFIYIHYPVGAKTRSQYMHEGEECGVVLEGTFKGTIGEREIILEAGDSIYYDSTIPHEWEAIGDKDVRAIWAITPPSF